MIFTFSDNIFIIIALTMVLVLIGSIISDHIIEKIDKDGFKR